MLIPRDCSFITGACKQIIIGLTGKTGAGCSEVAGKIKDLGSNMPNAPASLPVRGSADERAYAIVHNYLRTQCRPKVHVVSVTDIITHFLLTAPDGYINLRSFIDGTKHIIKQEELLPKLDALKSCFAQDKSMNFAPEATKQIRETLQAYTLNFRQNDRKQANCYTYVYQELGNTIRGTGSASLQIGNWEPSRRESDLHRLPEAIAAEIDKRLSTPNGNNNERTESPTIVVVDAIRNPFEALFLSRKYANFYLMAVNKPEQQRIRGLRDKGRKIIEIEDIDNQEWPGDDIDASTYHRVNISKCEEMADVYVVNDSNANADDEWTIDRQITKLLALMLKPGIVNPTMIEMCMQVANTAKLNSGCLSRQVGAVVTDKEYNILSVGWNTTPGNQVPCNLRSAYDLVARADVSAFSQYECENEDFRGRMALKLLLRDRQTRQRESDAEEKSAPFFPYCFKDVYNGIKRNKNQVHTRSIHGEEMAFLNKTGTCEDGILFTTSSPCELCAKKACHEGISRIYYLVPYRGIADEHILKGAGRALKIELFHGVTGGAFSKLYTPMIAQKDEWHTRDGFKFTDELKEVWIKPARSMRTGEIVYLRVAEDGNGEGKYAVQLSDSGSRFALVEEGQELLVQYTLKKELASREAKMPCPLCGDNSNKVGEACETCGHSNDLAKKRVVYLCADLCDRKRGRIKANRMHRHAWEKFKVKFLDESKFLLQSMANDYFVRVSDDGSIVADVEVCSMDAPGTGCVFQIEFPTDG